MQKIIEHLYFAFFLFIGTAGDSLGPHRGMLFSTKDRDNDKWSTRNILAPGGTTVVTTPI